MDLKYIIASKANAERAVTPVSLESCGVLAGDADAHNRLRLALEQQHAWRQPKTMVRQVPKVAN